MATTFAERYGQIADERLALLEDALEAVADARDRWGAADVLGEAELLTYQLVGDLSGSPDAAAHFTKIERRIAELSESDDLAVMFDDADRILLDLTYGV